MCARAILENAQLVVARFRGSTTRARNHTMRSGDVAGDLLDDERLQSFLFNWDERDGPSRLLILGR